MDQEFGRYPNAKAPAANENNEARKLRYCSRMKQEKQKPTPRKLSIIVGETTDIKASSNLEIKTSTKDLKTIASAQKLHNLLGTTVLRLTYAPNPTSHSI
jgi:hypothetical protein